MKLRPVLLFMFAAGLATLPSAAQSGPWENLHVTSDGREAVRPEFVSYDRRDDAVEYDYDKSPFYLPLDGNWYYRSVPSLTSDAWRFFDPAFTPDGTEATLPGYFAATDVKGLQKIEPPALPKDNSFALYRAQFEVPVLWLDRDVYVRIAGIKGGMTLYVNGIEVGYSEESGVPSEFLITPYVRDGINTLGLGVSRWSTAAWLENQTLAGAGIESGVSVWSQPPVHIHDFTVTAGLDSLDRTGILDLEIEVLNRFNMPDTAMVFFDISDAAGRIIRYNEEQTLVPGMRGRDTVRFRAMIPDVRPWSPGDPYQYHIIMRIRHRGRFTEYIPLKIGFKKAEVAPDGFRLNGRPLDIRCRDYTYNGIAPDYAFMRSEVRRIKSEGFNTLKCGYHPRKNRLYEICAEEGLMVIDEVGINSAATGKSLNVGGTIGNNPLWVNPFLERVENTWRYSRNHTALIGWSLGSEAGRGYNLYRSYTLMKTLETVRPVIYGPAAGEWNTDLIVTAAPFDETLRRAGADYRERSLLLEFTPGGNSEADYTNYKTDYPAIQGFIVQ